MSDNMNMMNVTIDLLTVRQFAERTGYKVKTVYNLVREGKLPAFRLNTGAVRFRTVDVEEWIESLSSGQKGEDMVNDSS